MTMLRNLGQVCGMLVEQMRIEHEGHEDLRMWGAPSECHQDVQRGFRLRSRILVEQIERSTGYTADELHDELTRRCSGKWLHDSGALQVLGEVISDRQDEETERRRLKYVNGSKLPGISSYHQPRHVPHVLRGQS